MCDTSNGYVKLFRSLVNWEWYTDVNTMRLFLHLLLTANHTDKKWQGIVIKRGSRVCSYPSLSKELCISEQSIRTAIKHLKLTGELTVKTTAKYSVISINNYDIFQGDNRLINSQLTGCQQTANRLLTTNKNEKKEKNDKNVKNIYTGSASEEIKNTLIDFIEMRKLIKSPMTERAVDNLINKLNGMSTSTDIQIQILNQSILNNWKSVYPLKDEPKEHKASYDLKSAEQEAIYTPLVYKKKGKTADAADSV